MTLPLQAPEDAHVKRVKSFTKDLRRARSFRSTREKSKTAGEVRLAARGYCHGSMFQESVLDLRGQEVTFLVKKSLSGRIGWKVMPEDDNLNLKMNASIMGQVMARIR